MQVSQHTQYQGSETGSPKWTPAIINVIIYTGAFPAIMCAETTSQLVD